MNYSTLEPKMSFSTPLKNYSDVGEEWKGQRSQRFARGLRFEPHKDLITTSSIQIT